jgi:hypothetical protein
VAEELGRLVGMRRLMALPVRTPRRLARRLDLIVASRRASASGHVSIKNNIPRGIWVHPEHVDPDRPFQLRGRVLDVRFSDRAISAVRSVSDSCSHGPNRPFLNSLGAQRISLICGPASSGA